MSSSSVRRRLLRVLFLISIAIVSQSVAGAQTEQLAVIVPPAKQNSNEDQSINQLRGLTRFTATPKEIAIARLLYETRHGALTPEDGLVFFKKMSEIGAGMQDVIRTKTLIEQAAIDNPSIKDDFLGTKYSDGGSTVEQAILVYRRNLTQDAIKQVIKEFAGKGTNHAVYLAEVGKWTVQADTALTFSGDIDFSFVSLDSQLTWAMKKRFDEIIQQRTGLDTVKFDSVCTAHGKATPDVYIGEHGRMYGDEAMAGGKLKPINLSAGTLGEGVAGESVIDQIVKELRVQRAAAGEIAPSSHSKEPGLSMEMVRHFTHDIVAPKVFDPIDSVLKAAKYVDRSNVALAQGLKGARPADPKLAAFCKEITVCAAKSNFKRMAELLTDYFGDALKTEVTSSGGKPVAKLNANRTTIDKFFESASAAMWKNAETGFRARIKDIDAKLSDLEAKGKEISPDDPAVQQMRADMVSLIEMCKLEFAACAANHLEVPATIKELFDHLKSRMEIFTRRKGVKPLTDEEMKQLRFIEECIRSGKKPLFKIAAAYTVDLATKGIEKTNNILDYLDDTLLGTLRGDSTDFDTFVQEARAIRKELNSPKQRTSVLSKIASLKTRAGLAVRSANVGLNNIIQSTSAGRGTMKVMMGVNLAQEAQAYCDAYSRDGYSGLATEFFRRRVPGGGIADAYYQGSYLRSGVELVYLIFPPAAIPEGMYGLVQQAVDWSGSKWAEWKYAALVDALYDDASFQPSADGFVLYKIRYDCSESGKGVIELSRSEAHLLPSKCPAVWQIIAPHIRNHPAVRGYEEMLDKQEVSSGRDSIFPYTYSGLSTYGVRLQQAYRKHIDKVVEEYFKGVIEELEKRRNFEGGVTGKKLSEIEGELHCSKPITDDRNNRALIEQIIKDYETIKKTNALIVKLKNQYKTEFLTEFKPVCSVKSLIELSSKAKEHSKALEEAVNDATARVESIIGKDDPNFVEKAGPATRCRIGMACHPKDSEAYRNWYEAYQEELGKLKPTALAIVFDCARTGYVGQVWEATIKYDRVNPKRIFQWEFLRNSTEKFQSATVSGAKWKPVSPGTFAIRLKVKEKETDSLWVTNTVEVKVLPADKAPKLRVKLNAASTNIHADEIMSVNVSPVEQAPGDPFVRYFWKEDAIDTRATDEPTYQFEGFGKSNKKVVLSVVARTGKGLLSQPARMSISVLPSTAANLRAWISPSDVSAISDRESIELRGEVARKANSGELRYQWSIDGRPVSSEKTLTIHGRDYIDKRLKVTFYVQDVVDGEIKREGQAEKSLAVVADKLVVILSGCPETLAVGEQLTVSVRKPSATEGDYSYLWYEWDGRTYSSQSYGDKNKYTLVARRAGSELGLKVLVKDQFGRSGQAETGKIRVVPPKRGLTVLITPPDASVIRGQSIKLSVKITGSSDSGVFTVNGVDLAPGASQTTLTVRAEKGDPATLSVTADVRDEKGRTGQATAIIRVREPYDSSQNADGDKGKTTPSTETPVTDGSTKNGDTKTGAAEAVSRGGVAVKIIAPRQILETEITEVAVQVPDTVAGRASKIYWTAPSIKLSNQGQKLQIQYSPGDAGNKNIGCNVSDASGQAIAFGEQPIAVKPAYIRAGLPEKWQANATSTAFTPIRQKSVQKGKYTKERAQLDANFYADFVSNFGFGDTPKEVVAAKELEGTVAGAPRPSPSIRSISVGDFTGAIKEWPGLVTGSVTSQGVRYAKVGARGWGALSKGRVWIVVSYQISGTGIQDSEQDDAGFLSSEGNLALGQIKEMLGSLRVTDNPSLTGGGGTSLVQSKTKPTAKIVGLSRQVTYGQTVPLEVQIAAADKQQKLNKYIWRADPSVSFKEGTTVSPKNAVTFDRMQPTSVSAQVEFVDGDGPFTVETPVVDVAVKAPAFKINFNPPSGGKPGQEISATINAQPDVRNEIITFRWDSPPSNNRMEMTDNARIVKFKLKDKSSYKLLVQPLVPHFGDLIGGGVTATYEGSDYIVKAIIEQAGPKPTVWDPIAKALVELPKDTFAAGERILLRASIEGEPVPEDVRWKWSVNEGTTISNDISATPTVSRSEPGTASAMVTARNKDDVILGQARVSIAVTVSAEETSKGKEKETEKEKEKTNQQTKAVKSTTFKASNDLAVENKPTQPFTFNVKKASTVEYIETYHWNYGRGSKLGQLGLRNQDTGELMIWNAQGRPGQGNVPNAYWYVPPQAYVVEPGMYELIDTDPSTWAQNAGSGGVGFAIVKLKPVAQQPTTAASSHGETGATTKPTPTTTDASTTSTTKTSTATSGGTTATKTTSPVTSAGTTTATKATSPVTSAGTTTATPTIENIEYVSTFAGTWESNWGRMTLSVTGVRIVGEYTHDKGKIEATLSADGKTMTGTWSEHPTYQPPRDAGKVTMTISADGTKLSGTWGYGSDINAGAWNATKLGGKPAAPISGDTGRKTATAVKLDTKPGTGAGRKSAPMPTTIDVVFENRDNQPIHLWSHGENISPYNRVVPNGTRRRAGLQLQSNSPTDYWLIFWAGRDGKEIHRLRWAGQPPLATGE